MGLCKICGGEIKGTGKTYCSNKCKFSDDEYNKRRNHGLSNPKTKKIRHRVTGKEFSDVLNLSGVLSRYSKKQFGTEYNPDDWEILDKEQSPTIKCPYCEWETVDINNNSGALSIHIKREHNKAPEDVIHEFPEFSGYWKTISSQMERESFIEKEEKNRIECKICNQKFKKITNSHLKKHGITVEEYKRRYGDEILSSDATRDKLSKMYFRNENILNLNYTSNGETEVKEFLESLNIPTRIRRKDNVEIDLFSDDHDIGIEYDGLYWHSEYHGHKGKKYHIAKTEYCEKNGIRLIHIFEDEWNLKGDIVRSRLRSLFGKIENVIYARKCIISEISPSQKNKFLVENHIQGKDLSKVNLGAFYEDELVAVMTFRVPNTSMGYKDSKDIELSRFCSKLNTTVVGIVGKFLSHFKRDCDYNKIISYADRRWTNIHSNLYQSVGFEFKGATKPNYWYMKGHKIREHRYNYAKYKILEKFENSDPSITEWENMIQLGYDRIWDCGSLKFEMKL